MELLTNLSYFGFLSLIFTLIGFFIVYFASLDFRVVELRAKHTHNNRGLQFTSNKIYEFYPADKILICNKDDLSNDRDNYSFGMKEIEEDFEPIDLKSKLILNRIKRKNS